MKTLYVIGQSTCYGMDLVPGNSGLSMREFRETRNFAGLLGKELGYRVVNSSYPMSSLVTMIRRIKEEYDQVNPDLVVVGIPQTTLREVWDEGKNRYINLMQKEFYFPKTVLVLKEDSVPSIYDTELQRTAYLEYRNGLTLEKAIADFENEVIELQSFLKSRDAKYVFVQMAPIVPNLINDTGYTDEENTIKQFSGLMPRLNEIDTDKWIYFDKFNAVDSLSYLPKGKTGHVLEVGHVILKDLIYEKIRTTYL